MVAVIWVSLLIVNVTIGVEPMAMAVTPVKLAPVTTTGDPAPPSIGAKLVIRGLSESQK
jgi:hypothetical protein